MKRRHLPTWLVRLTIVLAIIGVLAGWTAIANDEATSLRIIAWRSVADTYPSAPVSSVIYPVHFDKTYTDLRLVREVQDLMNGQRTLDSFNFECTLGIPVSYRYEFIFLTHGITTQAYSGTENCPMWDAVTYALWIPAATPFPLGGVENPFWSASGIPSTLWRGLGVPQG